MGAFSRLQKLAVFGVGAVSGGLACYQFHSIREEEKKLILPSFLTLPTQFVPSVKWDDNWDHREPKSIVKPSNGTPEDDNRYNTQLSKAKSKATRHLLLIRHGQYNLDGNSDKQHILTELGRRQAEMTGKRLASLGITFDLLVRSTMTRAQETGELIAKCLPEILEVQNCSLLEEGAPIPPEPPVGHWKPEPKQFFRDNARIEAAFRKYFHRASPDQKTDSYTVLVCHANVIRYFVCRALQFPPEGWLRISLNHGSITWISITPKGRVVLKSLGDAGYMDPPSVTHRNYSKK